MMSLLRTQDELLEEVGPGVPPRSIYDIKRTHIVIFLPSSTSDSEGIKSPFVTNRPRPSNLNEARTDERGSRPRPLLAP